MKSKSIYKWGISLLSLCLFTGCFDLTEAPFDEMTVEEFVPTEEDTSSLFMTTYYPMRQFYAWYGEFDAQEEPADVIITPVQNTGWYDGGVFIRNHKHTWTPNDGHVTGPYGRGFNGVKNANLVIYQLENDMLPVPAGENKEGMLAELYAMRAFWYSRLLDTHGNVPIVTDYTSMEIPDQATRQEVYDFVVKEFEDVIAGGKLSTEMTEANYGRMTLWAAYMSLARVYLNAGVYTGTPQWQKALDCVQKVIDSGKFQLSADFSDNFVWNTDHTNKEVIWSIIQDPTYAPFEMHQKWYPPGANAIYGGRWFAWSGSRANPQFINSYEGLRTDADGQLIADDKRFDKSWNHGPKYNLATGALFWDPFNYVPAMDAPARENSADYKYGMRYSENFGLRPAKFRPEGNLLGKWDNDIPFIRYAETLMIKAECLMRLGKDEGEAAALVSQIRARAFDDAAKATVTADWLKGDTAIKYGTIDLDGNIDKPGDQTPVVLGGLYDEWGWEFAQEMLRRQVMIRFGTFTTKNWFNHEALPENADGHTILFPFTYGVLNTNFKMEQNPGYPAAQ